MDDRVGERSGAAHYDGSAAIGAIGAVGAVGDTNVPPLR